MAHFLNLNEFNHDEDTTTYLNIAQIEKIVLLENKDSSSDSYNIIINTMGQCKEYVLKGLSYEQVEHLERLIGIKANIESY